VKNYTRREFLEKAILGAGAGAALTVFGPESMLAVTGDTRGYAAGKYGIEIDGIMAGWVESVEGGHSTSDVVNEKVGASSIQQKHIAGVKYEDITVNCGTGMSKAFYEWIKSMSDGRPLRKNGAIVACDFNFKEVSRTEWTGGIITEVGLPALDAASRDAARMTVKIAPESTRVVKGSGKSATGSQARVQKKWLPSNFRLDISGLDCRRVNKIEAITLKAKTTANRAAPNLVVTLSESDAAGWNTWQKSSISGRGGNSRSGRLAFLAPDLREELFTLTFYNLGISKLTPDKTEAGSANIRRVKAEMYCEEMKFSYGNGAWA
jgi:phage tail-like protein